MSTTDRRVKPTSRIRRTVTGLSLVKPVSGAFGANHNEVAALGGM